jgi:hypothetical protein
MLRLALEAHAAMLVLEAAMSRDAIRELRQDPPDRRLDRFSNCPFGRWLAGIRPSRRRQELDP